MLSIIHKDHVNMIQLLKILKTKIHLLEQGKEIDYRLIKAIITYLRSYSDKYHHPMEDLIYDYYLKFRVVPDQVANRLSQEHILIKQVTIELDELIDMILLDAIVPNEQCIEKLTHFVDIQSAHLNYEEQDILPKIQQSLTKDDWHQIEQQWHHDIYSDPLFGENISDQYKALAERINQV
jgi:hemerythrin-like domain-containing protein